MTSQTWQQQLTKHAPGLTWVWRRCWSFSIVIIWINKVTLYIRADFFFFFKNIFTQVNSFLFCKMKILYCIELYWKKKKKNQGLAKAPHIYHSMICSTKTYKPISVKKKKEKWTKEVTHCVWVGEIASVCKPTAEMVVCTPPATVGNKTHVVMHLFVLYPGVSVTTHQQSHNVTANTLSWFIHLLHSWSSHEGFIHRLKSKGHKKQADSKMVF